MCAGATVRKTTDSFWRLPLGIFGGGLIGGLAGIGVAVLAIVLAFSVS